METKKMLKRRRKQLEKEAELEKKVQEAEQ